MERNVWSFGLAIKNGLDPRNYTFDSDKVPLGEYEAVLDGKIWSKHVMAISCYFTTLLSKEKIQLTVYASTTGLYRVPGSTVDFTQCPTRVLYRIGVIRNNKGKIVWTKAVAVGKVSITHL